MVQPMYTIIIIIIVLRNDASYAIDKMYSSIIHKILNSTVNIISKNTIYGVSVTTKKINK